MVCRKEEVRDVGVGSLRSTLFVMVGTLLRVSGKRSCLILFQGRYVKGLGLKFFFNAEP